MNFDKLIEDMLKEGMTPEEAAKAFSTALNKRSEQEKTTHEREKVINGFKKVFIDHVNQRYLSNEDAAALFVTVVASESPECKDWTAEQIENFFMFVGGVLDSLPKQFNLFEKVHENSESLSDFIDAMDSIFNSMKKTDCCGNCHSKTEPCDNCKIHKPTPPMSDNERIRKFLEGLGK